MEHIQNWSEEIKIIINEINSLDFDDKIRRINEVKKLLHEISPFKSEPVDCVLWVKSDDVIANDYNPNKVAPPEMELLEISILNDGYTQPIVTFPNDNIYEIIDGFHRNRVGRESKVVKKRLNGYLPVTLIKAENTDRNNRIASTIRHNRARGKHIVSAMSEIVIELKNRNWANERIAKELGMDQDEILRLCQISGLEELFLDEDFSKSWNIDDSELDVEDFTDDITDNEKTEYHFRTVNTNDDDRIFHTYEKWECYKAGFYNTTKDGMTAEKCEKIYARFLSNDKEFREALDHIINEWKYSCEHYLTNKSMNRIAYLGQAAVCYSKGIPSIYRGGFNLLTEKQQEKANNTALEYLNKWLKKNGREKITLEEGLLIDKQVDIY